MKYHLITYGCQMNTADSEEMALPLQAHGYLATDDIQEADVAIMNTCTVREHAEHKAFSNLGRLREWKAERPERLLIVAGCAATLWGDSVKDRYPYIDVVSPATKIEEFPGLIQQALNMQSGGKREQQSTGEAGSGSPIRKNLSLPHALTDSRVDRLSAGAPFGNGATAYVTIMRGCNLSCSYCIVPQVRGREKYRPMPEILDEIRVKVAAGFREVMLLGQTVNSYYWRDDNGGEREKRSTGEAGSGSSIRENLSQPHALTDSRVDRSPAIDFADLLRAVNALDGVDCIRFMSPHPKHMRPHVIEALRDCEKVARHVHLPVQSGSNRLLASMKRLYTREEYMALVSRMRETIPGLAITTDVIVGYPGETEADIQDTLALLRDAKLDGLFAFKYSPRPGTASAEQADDVAETVKEERLQRVLATSPSYRARTKAMVA